MEELHKLILGAFAKLQKVTVSLVMYVCPSFRQSALKNSAPTGWILIKFDTWAFFENLSRKFKFRYNLAKITGNLHEDAFTFVTSRWILVRIRNVQNKRRRENQNTHFVFSNFLPKIVTFMRCQKKNVVETDAADNMAHARNMLDK
jgi:hypothetical protein